MAKRRGTGKKGSTRKPKKKKSNINLLFVFIIIVLIAIILFLFYSTRITDIEQPKPKVITKERTIQKDNGAVNRLEIFYQSISQYSRKFHTLSFGMGKDPIKDNKTDNSHLIFRILEQSAKKAGYNYPTYLTVDQLLERSTEVNISEVRNGDLIKTKDNSIALVFDLEQKDGFSVVYASEKNNGVVIVESRDLRKYWLNPDYFTGFYRISEELFR
ncbi:MAG: hypothetical protein JXR48_13400 [Candidatus Delongbacteria bacterium]|nr:hypothetical protein [Candidatus Delongbacteria bacterium]MBN2835951.1 hypothetical protein [Candidatus Delongbacteria bacterium]